MSKRVYVCRNGEWVEKPPPVPLQPYATFEASPGGQALAAVREFRAYCEQHFARDVRAP